MLKTIRLKNYQKHGDLVITFGPITVLVGPSDSGKSAALRALRWVLWNTPAGLAMLKEGEKETRVLLEVDDSWIQRSRSKSANTYGMRSVGCEPEKFTAFGNKVPLPIQEVANVDDVCFQGQHDPPFWLSLSAVDLARQINSVVDLSIVDRTVREATRRATAKKRRVEHIDQELTSVLKEVKSTAWVSHARLAMEDAVELEKTLDRTQGDRDDARDLADEIAAAEDESSILQTICQGHGRIQQTADSLSQEQRRLDVVRSYVDSIEQLEVGDPPPKIDPGVSNELRGLSVEIAVIEALISSVERCEHRPIPTHMPAVEVHGDLIQNRQNKSVLSHRVEELLMISQELDHLEDERAQAELLRRTVADSFGGVCPICGTKGVEL